ncbi:MAG: hypothetical protein PHN22_02275 [Candidatus ainarchaeum sp.]|nr:hypothetical protein [Candidatus ainarchaeum sp.]
MDLRKIVLVFVFISVFMPFVLADCSDYTNNNYREDCIDFCNESCENDCLENEDFQNCFLDITNFDAYDKCVFDCREDQICIDTCDSAKETCLEQTGCFENCETSCDLNCLDCEFYCGDESCQDEFGENETCSADCSNNNNSNINCINYYVYRNCPLDNSCLNEASVMCKIPNYIFYTCGNGTCDAESTPVETSLNCYEDCYVPNHNNPPVGNSSYILRQSPVVFGNFYDSFYNPLKVLDVYDYKIYNDYTSNYYSYLFKRINSSNNQFVIYMNPINFSDLYKVSNGSYNNLFGYSSSFKLEDMDQNVYNIPLGFGFRLYN